MKVLNLFPHVHREFFLTNVKKSLRSTLTKTIELLLGLVTIKRIKGVKTSSEVFYTN